MSITPPPAAEPQPTPSATTSAQQQYGEPAPKSSQTNALGIIAIVLGGIGFVLAFIPFVGVVGGFLAFVGLVLGVIGLFMKNKGKGTAIAGTAVSGLALILSIVMGLVYTAAFVSAVDDAVSVDDPVVQEPAADGGEAPVAEEEPAADSTLGTRENPAPFGSTVVIDTFEGSVWEVTAAAPNLNATADVKAANQFNPDPAPGNQYAILPVTVTYVGEESGRPFDLSFTYVSPAGQSYEGAFVAMDGQLSDVAELYKDASGTGNVIIEIPAEGAEQGTWGVEYIFGDEPIFFGAPK